MQYQIKEFRLNLDLRLKITVDNEIYHQEDHRHYHSLSFFFFYFFFFFYLDALISRKNPGQWHISIKSVNFMAHKYKLL